MLLVEEIKFFTFLIVMKLPLFPLVTRAKMRRRDVEIHRA